MSKTIDPREKDIDVQEVMEIEKMFFKNNTTCYLEKEGEGEGDQIIGIRDKAHLNITKRYMNGKFFDNTYF